MVQINKCKICNFEIDDNEKQNFGKIHGNTSRFIRTEFKLWKCPLCETIHALEPVDFSDIYRDYPLTQRKLDVYARGTLSHLFSRLIKVGLKQSDRILDYGSGNGIFVQFLKEKGFSNVWGYDPYVSEYSKIDEKAQFDFIVANDVIEHVEDPKAMLVECAKKVVSGGVLYVGTADSTGVQMQNLEPHLLKLHQPFHRTILTPQTLKKIVLETGFSFEESYLRSYMDTLKPFSNYRFLHEFSRALDFEMDRALDPKNANIVLRKPQLVFWGLFGYFFPIANEPAVIARKL